MISYDIMPKENQILVRVNDPMDNAVEEFAEDRDYTKAEASRKILESRLKGEGYLQRHYGDNDLEPLPDGGQVVEKIEEVEKEVQRVSESINSEEEGKEQLYRARQSRTISFIIVFGILILLLILLALEVGIL